MVELICKILKIGKASYYRYKKSNEPILNLLNYFTKQELEELLETGKIQRLEKNNNTANAVDNVNEALIEHTKYQLRDKLKDITDGSMREWLYNFFAKKILIHVLESLSKNHESNYHIMNSKSILIREINDLDIGILPNAKKDVLIDQIINKRLSNLDCYVLIKYYEEILNYDNYFQMSSKYK